MCAELDRSLYPPSTQRARRFFENFPGELMSEAIFVVLMRLCHGLKHHSGTLDILCVGRDGDGASILACPHNQLCPSMKKLPLIGLIAFCRAVIATGNARE